MMLTLKTEYYFEANSLEEFLDQDMFKCEWKRVQALASVFWVRWKKKSTFHYYRVAGNGQRVDRILPKEMWFSSKTRLNPTTTFVKPKFAP